MRKAAVSAIWKNEKMQYSLKASFASDKSNGKCEFELI